MADASTSEPGRDVVSRYFEADARRDSEAILALFLDDATVIDEGGEWRGTGEIRQWRLGPVSKYEYTTTLARIDAVDDTHYRASGRIDGKLPGRHCRARMELLDRGRPDQPPQDRTPLTARVPASACFTASRSSLVAARCSAAGRSR